MACNETSQASKATDEDEQQASTSTSTSTSTSRKETLTITDLKMFLVGELKETVKESMEVLKKELQDHQEITMKKCLAEVEQTPVSRGKRNYNNSLVRKALDMLTQLGPTLLKQITVKEETHQTEGDKMKALFKHVNAKLQLNQDGRLIEVLFNCAQFIEALALLLTPCIEEMMDGTSKVSSIGVYRYVLQRLFTQQQLAYMCFGGTLRTYVKIFHAYLNAFQ
jgi:hypothetical protein